MYYLNNFIYPHFIRTPISLQLMLRRYKATSSLLTGFQVLHFLKLSVLRDFEMVPSNEKQFIRNISENLRYLF